MGGWGKDAAIDRLSLRITARGDSAVRVDGTLVRHAIAKVIVYALHQPTPGTRVRLAIDGDGDAAAVRVVSQGPPYPYERAGSLRAVRPRSFCPTGHHHGRGPGVVHSTPHRRGLRVGRPGRSSREHTTFCIELPAKLTVEPSGTEES
jgi:hypothetical protein